MSRALHHTTVFTRDSGKRRVVFNWSDGWLSYQGPDKTTLNKFADLSSVVVLKIILKSLTRNGYQPLKTYPLPPQQRLQAIFERFFPGEG